MDFGAKPIDELRQGAEIAFVSSDATVGEAYEVLLNKNVYSVPVYDSQSNSYVGLVDLVDIVALMMQMFYETAGVHSAAELKHVVSSKWKKEIANIKTRLMSTKAVDVINKSGQNPFKLLAQGTPVHEVISFLTNDVRRVPVVDGAGKIVQMVSQADIMRYIHSKHMPSFEHKLKRQIGGCTHKAVDVEPSTRTLDCFALMMELRISALPIVDHSDRSIIGVITLRDVQGGIEDMTQLFTPVEDFISYMRQKNIGTLREFPFISMHDTDTLEKAMNKIIAAKIHRVFVKKNGTDTLFVLTVKDILQSLMH